MSASEIVQATWVLRILFEACLLEELGLTPVALADSFEESSYSEHLRSQGYPFNRRNRGRRLSTGGSLEGAPGSAGARARPVARAAPPRAAGGR